MRRVNLSMTDIPKLTIVVPTYNREKYMAQALDSILMQKTNYSYGIIIADDASSDNSLKIAEQYHSKYPNKIKILTSKTNQKLYKNILRVYAILRSKYFCVLDPDDYWTSELKIQKSLDFLESNKDYAIYSANTLLKYVNDNENTNEKERRKLYINRTSSKTSTFQDYLRGRSVIGHTSSLIYRNVVFMRGIPEQMINIPSPSCEISFRGDSFRNVLHIHRGKSFFSPEVDSVYRICDDGIWQGSSLIEQNLMNCNFFKDVWIFFDKSHLEFLEFGFRRYYNKIASSGWEILMNDKNFEKYCPKDLYDVFRENNAQIQTLLRKKIKFKHNFLLWVYNKLNRKLSKKGLA